MDLAPPADAACLFALAAAALVVAFARQLFAARARVFVACAAVCAAALSAAYVAVYLRGGPRIVDATSYLLEARALAEGHLTFALGEPAASTIGRFLVRPTVDAAQAAVIFPPGYPALLALGVLVGAPLAVGPALAAALVVATYALARRVEGGADDACARVAAMLSVACAALRYHTADTMSHGLAAACFTGALGAAFASTDALAAADRRGASLHALAAGACAGWLVATRPVSGLALAAALTFSVATRAVRAPPRLVALAAIAACPFFALWVAHEHAATGSLFASAQRAYYAASDGPPGCFAYGFGRDVGCIGEHGDFVAARLAHGFDALAAAGTTLRRLRAHLLDAANAEPLFALVVAGAVVARRSPRARVLVVAVVAQVLAYAPFYFDGNYPGGGARMFADVLPIEHVLAAIAATTLAGAAIQRGLSSLRAPARDVGAVVIGLSLLGFACRAHVEHERLRDREGGRPMFEAATLTRAGVTRGLLFVDTDHGFDLAFDPDARAETAVAAVRARGDDLDRIAWEARGRPPAFRYAFDLTTGAAAVTPTSFARVGPPYDVRGESLWPALAQDGAFAFRTFEPPPCASQSAELSVRATGSAPRVELALPAAFAGLAVAPEVALAPRARGVMKLVSAGRPVASWRLDGDAGPLTCKLLLPRLAPSAAPLTLAIELERGSAPVAIDVVHASIPVDRNSGEVPNSR